MLVNMKEIFDKLNENEAVLHFNINNLEWTKYILEVVQEENTPVILGVSESAIKYMGGYKTVYNLVSGLVLDLNIKVPVVIHLDHGHSVESCKKAIDAGFTSVMIDASSLPLYENIEITKEVAYYAKTRNVTVEAELGSMDAYQKTNPKEVKEFVLKTGIDALAPSIGNAHGIYKGEVKLDIPLIEEIAKIVDIPLVLHGGTGIPDNQIKEAIKSGIKKININTELQTSWASAVREYIINHKDVYDPRKIISSGKIELKNKVKEKIRLCKNNNI